jgi:uncharacterized tellurite resistance protein B-like protein
MFLAELSSESQHAFLNLAVALIKADGKVTQDELNTMNMYKAEITGMKDISEYSSDNIEKSINCIAELDVQTRKKLYFELVSLAYSDSDYSEDEKKLIDNIITQWKLDAVVCSEIDIIASDIIKTLGKLGELINE